MTQLVIVTRTKDRPLFLKRALESVSYQNYKDYIHVIINDGGDVGVVNNIVDALSPTQKEKTKVFHRDTSSGAPDTIFNESIDRVKSVYFAIHDDDDVWHENFLSIAMERLEQKPDLGAVVVRTDKVIESVQKDTIKEIMRQQWMPDIKAINLYRQCIDNQFTPIASVFRRSAYESVGKFDVTLPIVGDWEFGIRLLKEYDADFIDPGYALAEYHHRKNADNSFALHDHRYYTNLIMNRYLREELSQGQLGIGYIMSKLRYDQTNMSALVRRILPSFIANKLKKKVQN